MAKEREILEDSAMATGEDDKPYPEDDEEADDYSDEDEDIDDSDADDLDDVDDEDLETLGDDDYDDSDIQAALNELDKEIDNW